MELYFLDFRILQRVATGGPTHFRQRMTNNYICHNGTFGEQYARFTVANVEAVTSMFDETNAISNVAHEERRPSFLSNNEARNKRSNSSKVTAIVLEDFYFVVEELRRRLMRGKNGRGMENLAEGICSTIDLIITCKYFFLDKYLLPTLMIFVSN